MNAPTSPPIARTARGFGGLLLATLALNGCAFPPPMSDAERDAMASCRSDANRVYDAQNRYQLSERDDHDAPYSGGAQPVTNSALLADQYQQDETVSDCMKHSAAVPVSGTAP